MALVPVEVLSERYRIAYVPSGSVLARLKEKHRPLSGSAALALGDPTLSTPPAPAPPGHGLLVKAVLPAGNAARAGLRPGDVLLAYNGTRLDSPDDLRPSQAERVPALRWRDGEQTAIRLGPGALQAVFDPRSAPAAVRAWRKGETVLVRRGEELAQLPGTRSEVLMLKRLLPDCTTLLGSDASEQRLHRLATSGQLKRYRLLHLGTHGLIDLQRPERSHLVLARDRLPSLAQNADAASRGEPVFTGELSVQSILSQWRLDCDLVVLSACRTALGKDAGGDGLLGFSQALLRQGARSVLLSRWAVDDNATALLMTRFYENLLGKRADLKKALKRAEALHEAQSWLRSLSRKEALAHLGERTEGVVRGPIVSRRVVVEKKVADSVRPYAAPYFWAAFLLIGDPD